MQAETRRQNLDRQLVFFSRVKIRLATEYGIKQSKDRHNRRIFYNVLVVVCQ